jgi:CubicO group peptidase (beta-lactamase class C family)
LNADYRFVLAAVFVLASLRCPAQLQDSDVYDTETNHDYETPNLADATSEERAKAVRDLKRVERRSKAYRIYLNRGKMEKLKGERLFRVLKEYDRFVSIIEELPEGFVKACNIGSVWFSDEIVDASGSHAGGFASGEGINLSMGVEKGTVYHEMFHKFECCITDSQRREWEELNPKEFIYEGSQWDAFAGNDKRSQKDAAKHLKRIQAGKEKSAKEKLEESRTKKDNRRIAANKTNETVQAAFINAYAQTTPGEDRAEVFRCMMEEGPRFFLRVERSEHMRRKMEFIMRITGTKKYLGANFWEEHSNVSSGGTVLSDMPSAYPDEMGYDKQKFEAMVRAMNKHGIATESMIVAVGGKVIFEYGDTARPADVSSCWPSLVSILYGKYVQMMKIDLDETLDSIGISDNSELQRRERLARVRDVISCRSGCFLAGSNDRGSRKLPERTSRLPGSEFIYSNWDVNVAASILERKTGSDVFSIFEEMIARPLGLQDWNRSQQRRVGDVQVSEHLACEFHLSARDLARIGQMMLNKGRWKGIQVVPADWVEKSTSASTVFPGGGGFGYMWWVENESQSPKVYKGAFSARGLEGQRITVIPQLDMVVVHLPRRWGTKKVRGAEYKKLLTAVFMSKKDPPL